MACMLQEPGWGNVLWRLQRRRRVLSQSDNRSNVDPTGGLNGSSRVGSWSRGWAKVTAQDSDYPVKRDSPQPQSDHAIDRIFCVELPQSVVDAVSLQTGR